MGKQWWQTNHWRNFLFIFRNVTFSDNGKYKCNVSNPYGWTSEEGSLRVKRPTTIKGILSGSYAELGKSAKLVCNVTHDSYSSLHIKWLKDKKHISQNEKLFSSITIKRTPLSNYQTEESLTIHKATKRHSGEYTCLAETEIDYDQMTSKVKIKLPENYVVVYISISICLITTTVTYLTYPYCRQKNK